MGIGVSAGRSERALQMALRIRSVRTGGRERQRLGEGGSERAHEGTESARTVEVPFLVDRQELGPHRLHGACDRGRRGERRAPAADDELALDAEEFRERLGGEVAAAGFAEDVGVEDGEGDMLFWGRLFREQADD